MTTTKRPNFPELAREWLVRATGHARESTEQSLANELERIYELGRDRGIFFTAGEDLRAGAQLEVDPVTGRIVAARAHAPARGSSSPSTTATASTASRPYLETWSSNVKGAAMICNEDGRGQGVFMFDKDDYGRARLAAQAPAMARLLLEALAAPGDFDTWLARADETLRAAGVE